MNDWIALIPALAGLALLDSLSFGTLAIPVWLLLAPGRVRPVRLLTYLTAIGAFYFAVGTLLLAGIAQLPSRPALPELDEKITRWIGLISGGALVFLSHVLDPATKARRGERKSSRGGLSGRLSRWRSTAMGDGVSGHGGASAVALAGLAIVAGTAELTTMLPYLGAIGLIATSGVPAELRAGVLACYCVIMLLPALVLLAARIVGGDRLHPPLERLDAWITRNAGSTLAWVIGIIGVILIIRNLPAIFPS